MKQKKRSIALFPFCGRRRAGVLQLKRPQNAKPRNHQVPGQLGAVRQI